MEALALALYAAIPAAFLAIGTKVLAGPVIERIVAAVTFWGLSKLSKKTSNDLDDELVLEALVAYYGKDHKRVQQHLEQAVTGPSASPSKGPSEAPATIVPAAAVTAVPEAAKESQPHWDIADELAALR